MQVAVFNPTDSRFLQLHKTCVHRFAITRIVVLFLCIVLTPTGLVHASETESLQGLHGIMRRARPAVETTGTSQIDFAAAPALPSKPNGNVVLYLSNQSYVTSNSLVTVGILLRGKPYLLFHGSLPVHDQHHRITRKFDLPDEEVKIFAYELLTETVGVLSFTPESEFQPLVIYFFHSPVNQWSEFPYFYFPVSPDTALGIAYGKDPSLRPGDNSNAAKCWTSFSSGVR